VFFGAMAMTVIVATVAILYRFFGDKLASAVRPENAASFSNPEFFVPVICFLVSVAALWFYTVSPSPRLPVSPSSF